MTMSYSKQKSVLSQYEVKDRADPTKYLYDALDSYFGVVVGNTSSALSIKDLLTLKVMASNDAENVAQALEYLDDDYLVLISDAEKNLKRPINDLEDLLNKNKISALKIQLILRGMKLQQPMKMKLKAGHVKEEKSELDKAIEDKKIAGKDWSELENDDE